MSAFFESMGNKQTWSRRLMDVGFPPKPSLAYSHVANQATRHKFGLFLRIYTLKVDLNITKRNYY